MQTLCLAGILTMLQPAGPAMSHVDDVMPDAVAEMEYQILLDFQPERTDVRNKLAMVLYRKKKYKEAEAEIQKVLKSAPSDFNALDGLGLVMTKTGRNKEAVEQFLTAIKTNPQDVMVHYHLGQAYAALGDAVAAGKSYTEALDLAAKPGATVTPADLENIRKALEQTKQASAGAPLAK